jgi:hypothetical protein
MFSQHYWRIHARVTRRVWSDLPQHVRDVIAADDAHLSPQFKWFEAKVHADTLRLYEDPAYFDNLQFGWQYPK